MVTEEFLEDFKKRLRWLLEKKHLLSVDRILIEQTLQSIQVDEIVNKLDEEKL